MRKPWLYLALGALLLSGAVYFIRSEKPVKNEAYYAALSQYLYAYTAGAIGPDDVIRVRFVNAAVSAEQTGQPVASGLLSFEPRIEGEAVWENDRTIKIKPAQPLPYGQHYEARLALRRLCPDAPAVLRRFDFEFNVRSLAYEVETDGIAMDAENPGNQHITGRIRINEPCTAAKVEQVLSARQGAKALAVSWTHDPDGRTHEWTVAGVERANVPSKVKLAWDGAAIGAAKKGGTDQVVPARDEFVALSAKAVQIEEQFVQINFSDPIAATRDLAGLIHLEGYPGRLRYVTDGNFVRVYPSGRLRGTHKLLIEAGVRNTSGQALSKRSEWGLVFEDLKPGVRLVGRGAIIPQASNGGVIFPFEAVGLSALDVEVFKIFNSNILQFLQVNEIEGDNELERVGKIVYQKKIKLDELNPEASSKNWQRYALDLKDMIKQDPGAIYQVRFAFRRSYTTCGGSDGEPAAPGTVDEDGNLLSVMGGWRGIYWQDSDENEWWGEGDDYNWDNRENPCSKEYYNREHFSKRNVFVSDLGLTAKRGRDGSLFMAVTDLHSAQPVSGVELELFDYQLQSITKTRSGADGTVMVEKTGGTPFLAVATGGAGGRRGYLRMADGSTLSLSRFDVAGTEMQKGLKGFIYGERGVWRPGDSLYLNFVLEDKSGKLPAGHPVAMELVDPRGAVQYRSVQHNGVGGVYPLHCATRPEAPTGNWTCRVKVGGATFTKTLKIETVKPNRLKLALDFGRKFLSAQDPEVNGRLAVSWLHGAVARNLKAKVEMLMRSTKTEFPNFRNFSFDDPARSYYSEPQTLFEGETDASGGARVPLKMAEDESAAPGKLIASFKVRAFEHSGDFSTDNFAMDYFPYDRYVGVSIPTDRWGGKSFNGSSGVVSLAMVDKNGRPLANQSIKVGLYRCDWRWWWDEDRDANVAQFNSADFVDALETTTLTTNASGTASWRVKFDGWGRYFVRAMDAEGGHAAGDFFWSGYPDQLDDLRSRNAAAMLSFTADKEKYTAGDEVTLKVPASESGRILVTLETGTRVAQHLWFDAKAGDNLLKFKTTESMAPTVYAHVSLIQPHAQTKNDLPIRMYGVLPVNVENPMTRLSPQIDMPDVLRPEENFNVAVREASGKACTYTLAIVDEGLLDLTRFQTPNPWDAFYTREALGVKTWDVYDYVLGAYGAELSRILAIGGDGINQKAKNASQVNRFKPAVIHVGPFALAKGQKAVHKLKINNYVGSVRVMVVMSAPASDSRGAYGSAEKTCPVRKPLMVLPTLPRVLGPGESLKLPVSVFAMENKVKSATISVREKTGLVSVAGAGQNTLNFAQPGDQMTYFDLKVGQKTGPAKFIVTAEGAGESASAEIEILVRNPNPVVNYVWEGTIEPGKEWSAGLDPGLYSDIANAVIEVSPLPSFNLSRHLSYLIRYPHGCVEQTTSTAFPQLFVDIIAPLTDRQKQDVATYVAAAINKIRDRQVSGGGFAYWPGGDVNEWASTYAGHFLLEAKNKGYAVPEGVIDRWLGAQTSAARSWSANSASGYYHDDLTQAYRLYTLALAGKPDLSSMNRLREKKDMYTSTAGMLANAYAAAGKPEAAKDLLNARWREDWRYDYCGETYGSDLRDRALLLETYVAGNDMARAQAMVNYLTTEMGKENGWYWNTQGLATGLRALSKYVAKNFGNSAPAFEYRLGENAAYQQGDRSKPIAVVDFSGNARNHRNVGVKNNSAAKLYARVVLGAQPLNGEQRAMDNNISLSIRYLDVNGQAIDPARITQGADFTAEVTVKRQSAFSFPFNELALTQIFPSGWEIMNNRMSSIPADGSSPADYQDVRDDRVLTYFDLPNNKDDMVRVYKVQLNAAYAGRYYLPMVSCEGMYDNRIRASTTGRWVEVI